MVMHIAQFFHWDKNIPIASKSSDKNFITLSGLTYYGESLSNRKVERYKRILGIMLVAFGTLCIIPSVFLATQGLYGKSIKWLIELENNLIIHSKIKEISTLSQKTFDLQSNRSSKSLTSLAPVNNNISNKVVKTDLSSQHSQAQDLSKSLPRCNEKERKIRKAQQEISDLYESNPFFSTNRVRIYYKKTSWGSFQQQTDDPWKKALEENNEKAIEEFLQNPHFEIDNFTIASAFEWAIEKDSLSTFKLLVQSQKTDLSSQSLRFWMKDVNEFESLLFRLIKKNKEEYIDVLLKNHYDINLLEKNYHSLSGYEKLSEECRNKIEQAIKKNNLDLDGYNSLERAILEKNIHKVEESLAEGVCINREKRRSLRLALECYMCGNSEGEEIFNILMQHSSLRLQSTDRNLLAVFFVSNKPDNWESLCAQLIEKGVDPTKGDVVNLFQYLGYENLSEEGPIKKALNFSQKIMLQNCLNEGFIHTIFELQDGNVTTDVYKMLQIMWELFKGSDSVTKNFSLQTIQKLSLSLNTIPLNFRKEQADELLEKVKDIPIIIPTGWNSHATSIVIYKNKIIYGNVGQASRDFQHGLHLYTFKPDQLTKNLLASLPDSENNNKMLFRKSYIESTIFEKLNAKKEEVIELPSQKKGNCTWASSALLGFFSALFFLSEKDLSTTKDFIYNEFEPSIKLSALKKYIENYKIYLSKAAYVKYERDSLLDGLLSSYLHAAMELPENEKSLKKQLIYEAIDSLIYSGLKFNLIRISPEEKEFLAKNYDLPWSDLESLLNKELIDHSKSYWRFR